MSKGKIKIGDFSFDSEGEAVLYLAMIERDLENEITLQYRFDLIRRWRFDFAFPKVCPPLAVEVEGGVFSSGGHVRGLEYTDNCRKYNRAVELGWRVLRFTTNMVNNLEAINMIERVLRKTKSEE